MTLYTNSISAVIPAFNAAGRIAHAIEALAKQSLRPQEIIVIDDGSSDATSSEARAALTEAGLPGRVLQLETNAGPSAARNIGWNMASSPWIQFLDDDDGLHPRKLEWQVPAVESASDNVAMLFSPWSIRTRTSGAVSEIRREPSVGGQTKAGKLASILEDENFVHISSGLFSKQWLEIVGGFDERLRLIEDVDLQIRLIANGAEFLEVPTPSPVFFYNRRAGSVSSTKSSEFMEALIRNARLAYSLCTNSSERAILEPALRGAFSQAIPFYASAARTTFKSVFAEAEPFFKESHRSGSPAFEILVALLSWKRAELVGASMRRFRNWFV